MPARIPVLAGLVGLVLFAVGCSDAPQSPEERFIEEFVDGALPDASEFQAEIVADGEVTFTEYERSVLATLACARDRGLETFGPDLEPDGLTYGYGYRGVDSEGNILPDAVVLGRFDICYAEYGELVDSVWAAQNAESFGDAPRRVKDAYLACLAEHGIDLDPESHITEIVRVLNENAEASACVDAADAP
jgi:hypothetical protein